MRNTRNIIIILLMSFFLFIIGSAQPPPCTIKTVGPGSVERASPPLTIARDPVGDLNLYHPLFEENFDVVYGNYDAIPRALDMVGVELLREGRNYYFRVLTAGENIPELLQERRQSAIFGVFVDTDLNGISDFLLTTTIDPEYGMVVSPNFEFIDEMPSLVIDSTSVTMSAPISLLGEHFEWVAFTGYSPIEEAYYLTPLEDLFVVPVLDMAYADINMLPLIYISLSGTGKQCQVTDMGLTYCPPSGNPPGYKNLPGPTGPLSKKGWMFWQKKCGDLKIELWCYGAFGRWIEKGSNKGWIARCPFKGGQNYFYLVDKVPPPNGDGVPERVLHDVYNGKFHWGFDDDCDGYWDSVHFDYSFATNLVTIKNKEWSSPTMLVVDDDDPQSPHKPFDDPGLVPGVHPGPPTHGGYIPCPPSP